jgi:hypothetical protein
MLFFLTATQTMGSGGFDFLLNNKSEVNGRPISWVAMTGGLTSKPGFSST